MWFTFEGFGFGCLGISSWVFSSVLRVLGVVFGVWEGTRTQCPRSSAFIRCTWGHRSGFRTLHRSGFRVRGLGSGLGLRVSGLGFRV